MDTLRVIWRYIVMLVLSALLFAAVVVLSPVLAIVCLYGIWKDGEEDVSKC